MDVAGFEGDFKSLNGAYNRDAKEHHQKPVYKKTGTDFTCYIYFWADRDNEDMNGWWMSSAVGSERTWAHASESGNLPPRDGWEVHDDDNPTSHNIRVTPRPLGPKKRITAESSDRDKNKFRYGAPRIGNAFVSRQSANSMCPRTAATRNFSTTVPSDRHVKAHGSAHAGNITGSLLNKGRPTVCTTASNSTNLHTMHASHSSTASNAPSTLMQRSGPGHFTGSSTTAYNEPPVPYRRKDSGNRSDADRGDLSRGWSTGNQQDTGREGRHQLDSTAEAQASANVPASCTTMSVLCGKVHPGNRLDELSFPHDLCIDKNGAIFVADTGNHRILKFAPGSRTGQVVVGGSRGKLLNQLDHPWSVAFDATGALYVSDTGNHRVIRYAEDSSGKFGAPHVVAGAMFCQRGADLSRLDAPHGIAIDAIGVLYIADRQNHRVMKWPPNAKQGLVVAGTRIKGTALNCLHSPVAVHVDKNYNVTVADTNNHRVLEFATTGPESYAGKLVAGGHGEGSGPAQLTRPHAVAKDSRGNLYVADKAKSGHRVVQIARGFTLKTIARVNALAERQVLLHPNGIKFHQGDLYVVVTGQHQLLKYSRLADIVPQSDLGTLDTVPNILPALPEPRNAPTPQHPAAPAAQRQTIAPASTAATALPQESEARKLHVTAARTCHRSPPTNETPQETIKRLQRELELERSVKDSEVAKIQGRLDAEIKTRQKIVEDMANFVLAAERKERGGRVNEDDVWQLLSKWHPDNAPGGAKELSAAIMRSITRERGSL